MIQPVPDIPALKIDDALVIGDLHIGVEAHLGKKGVHLVSHTKDMLDSIFRAADVSTDRIILLGDVKDSVPGSTSQEYREIPQFCDTLLENFSEVSLVRGNHDTSIEEFVPGAVRIYPSTGMRFGRCGLVHGHTWPSREVMEEKTLVMCHEHPTVLFRDGIGAHMSEPCWMRGSFVSGASDPRYDILPERFIVLPAFNRLLGGSPVNAIGTSMLGPILNSDLVDLDNTRIYLLDGLDLGRRGDLMVKDRSFVKWDDDENSPRHTAL